MKKGVTIGIIVGAVCAVLLLMVIAYMISKRMPHASDESAVGALYGAGVMGGR